MPASNMDVGAIDTKAIEPVFLPETKSTAPSAIMYTLHKAGSVYFGNCIRALAEAAGMPGINMATHYFKFGLDQHEFPLDAQNAFKTTGYFYGPFRSLALSFKIAEFEKYTKLFMVRDPRDILTSFYFSNKFSHPRKPPKPGEAASDKKRSDLDIDSYVIRLANRFATRFTEYQQLVVENNVSIFKYEYIIDNFEPWLHEVAKVMSLDPPQAAFDSLIAAHVSSVDEDVNSHRRQIRPGDHIRKLQPETIDVLNKKFESSLKFFEYS